MIFAHGRTAPSAKTEANCLLQSLQYPRLWLKHRSTSDEDKEVSFVCFSFGGGEKAPPLRTIFPTPKTPFLRPLGNNMDRPPKPNVQNSAACFLMMYLMLCQISFQKCRLEEKPATLYRCEPARRSCNPSWPFPLHHSFTTDLSVDFKPKDCLCIIISRL